jgi:hypothetical protein
MVLLLHPQVVEVKVLVLLENSGSIDNYTAGAGAAVRHLFEVA